MQLKFDTQNLNYAKAALLLYAMYRSKEANSSLNGIETWSRCAAYLKVASIKSTTMPEFIQNFCKKANIKCIKPYTIQTDGLVQVDEVGTLASVPGIYNYQLEIQEDSALLDIFRNESLYVISLVRDRLQREKEEVLYETTV